MGHVGRKGNDKLKLREKCDNDYGGRGASRHFHSQGCRVVYTLESVSYTRVDDGGRQCEMSQGNTRDLKQ